jgi:hypothetical protein
VIFREHLGDLNPPIPKSTPKGNSTCREIAVGNVAIKQRKVDASVKYEYSCEADRSEQMGRMIVVTCKLKGKFLGSPIDLRYFFSPERG